MKESERGRPPGTFTFYGYVKRFLSVQVYFRGVVRDFFIFVCKSFPETTWSLRTRTLHILQKSRFDWARFWRLVNRSCSLIVRSWTRIRFCSGGHHFRTLLFRSLRSSRCWLQWQLWFGRRLHLDCIPPKPWKSLLCSNIWRYSPNIEAVSVLSIEYVKNLTAPFIVISCACTAPYTIFFAVLLRTK